MLDFSSTKTEFQLFEYEPHIWILHFDFLFSFKPRYTSSTDDRNDINARSLTVYLKKKKNLMHNFWWMIQTCFFNIIFLFARYKTKPKKKEISYAPHDQVGGRFFTIFKHQITVHCQRQWPNQQLWIYLSEQINERKFYRTKSET